MRIGAFDQSTNKVGFAVMEDMKLIHYELIDLEKEIKSHDEYLNKDYLERIALWKQILLDKIKEWSIQVVGFEDTILTSFGGVSSNQVDVLKKLTKSLGVAEITLIEKQIAFETIPAGVHRKGKGFGKKREEIKSNAITYVNERYGLSLRNYNPKSKDNDDDIADSITIAEYLSKKFSK